MGADENNIPKQLVVRHARSLCNASSLLLFPLSPEASPQTGSPCPKGREYQTLSFKQNKKKSMEPANLIQTPHCNRYNTNEHSKHKTK
jgi:hypothetical protein